jgi:hypothetical protein
MQSMLYGAVRFTSTLAHKPLRKGRGGVAILHACFPLGEESFAVAVSRTSTQKTGTAEAAVPT